MDSTDFNEMSWAVTGMCEISGWVTPPDQEATRESWLLSAIDRMAVSLFPAFKRPRWRVTCGWPKGTRGGKHAVGQCWPPTASKDGTSEMFISPELDDYIEVLHTLAHEMIHAIVGNDCGHRGEFVKLCKRIGLVKPWTSTTPGPELTSTLAIYAVQLGPYPHARLNDLHKKQTARMLKAVCPNPACGLLAESGGSKPYTVRIAQQWADAGMPACPCGAVMQLAAANDYSLPQAA
jgi:hypothetical protein